MKLNDLKYTLPLAGIAWISIAYVWFLAYNLATAISNSWEREITFKIEKTTQTSQQSLSDTLSADTTAIIK